MDWQKILDETNLPQTRLGLTWVKVITSMFTIARLRPTLPQAYKVEDGRNGLFSKAGPNTTNYPK